MERAGDLGEIQIAFPDHLLAFLQLDAPYVLAGGQLQMLVEEAGQITGAYINILCYQGYGQLAAHVVGNKLLGTTDDLVLVVDALGLPHRGLGFMLQTQQRQK